jgi:hypothetical protein
VFRNTRLDVDIGSVEMAKQSGLLLLIVPKRRLSGHCGTHTCAKRRPEQVQQKALTR